MLFAEGQHVTIRTPCDQGAYQNNELRTRVIGRDNVACFLLMSFTSPAFSLRQATLLFVQEFIQYQSFGLIDVVLVLCVA